jgi:hypothetical protein
MAQATRSWHANSTFTHNYEHMFIIATCQEVSADSFRGSPPLSRLRRFSGRRATARGGD